MSKKRDVTINIKPFHCEVEDITMTGFVLKFWSNIGDDYTRRKYVRIHLEWHWIAHIVKIINLAYVDVKSRLLRHGKDAGFEDE